MENSSKKEQEISEFLNIYPPLSLFHNSAETKKFLAYFNRVSTRLKTIRKSTRKNTSKNNSTKYSNNETNIFLIDKAIEQQENNMHHSQDIKEALKLFLYHSNLISKLKNYFSVNDYSEIKDIETNINIDNLEENIKTVVSKLSESVIVEKYVADKFIIRMNEIGRDCYFLISGKLSVLKPVEYRNIKISYKDYLIYLNNLYHNNEIDLLKKVISINNETFLKFHNLEKILTNPDEIKFFIKSYCITKLNLKIKRNLIDYKNLKLIEKELKEFNLSFLDYNIDENEVEENIKQIISNEFDDRITIENKLKKYILQSFKPANDDIYNMIPYEFLINESIKEQINLNNNGTAVLYKYDVFLYLYPGAFFGETALENVANNRRNATIRTEEDCIIISLNQRLYNSILYESTKLIKELDILFLKKNFFFNEIQSNIFNKLYFPMFKLISKNKNDFIFQQNSELKSIYFLKEGEIRFEAYLSAVDMHKLIKYYIDYINIKKKYFKMSNEQIDKLKKIYLYDNNIINGEREGLLYRKKINEINKYEIYTTKNPDCLGILEFSTLMNNYISSNCVISKNAKLFEINKENLYKLVKFEKAIIQQDYYRLIKNKILILIKRFYYLKLNFLSNIKYKINQNFFDTKNYKTNSINRNNFSLDNSNESKEAENNREKNYVKIKNNCKNKLISKYFGHFNYDVNKNLWSPVSFRNIKYNEKYFFNKKLNLTNKKTNINNNTNIHLSNSEYNIDYNDVIKTLMSLETKNQNLKKHSFISPRKELDLKNIINIGKNHIFTLKKLKEDEKKNKISKSMLNLSIVKNDFYKTKKNSGINKIKIKSFFNLKNMIYKYKKLKIKKIISTKREYSNNTTEKNTLNSTNENNMLIVNYKKIK